MRFDMVLPRWAGVAATALVLIASAPFAQADETPLDRTILPLREPQPPVYTEIDVRKAKAPERFEVRPPAGAPNVLLVLIDDLGFA